MSNPSFIFFSILYSTQYIFFNGEFIFDYKRDPQYATVFESFITVLVWGISDLSSYTGF